MSVLLYSLYFAVCLMLIVLVLLQHGKGADIGVSLGGGASNTVFGARGAGNFLTKLTTGSAILFMILAFGLSRWAGQSGSDLLSTPAGKSAPATTEKKAEPEKPPESAAPPTEPGAPPSGFETVEPPKPATPEPPGPPPAPPPAH
ncbi:MAG TPA: preprotein translocase subunit SecG [Myxococcota bacterium]|nr:preprotein translocase subunit SecG [Myxococcota bacterium]